MLTTIVNLDAIRGDNLERLFTLASGGVPLTEEAALELKARFTDLRFQIREDPDSPEPLASATHEDGAVEIVTAPVPGVALHVPAARMAALPDVYSGLPYDLQLTEPREGHLLGPLVWTIASGVVQVRKDTARP